jgi:hypothetical protein
MERTDNSWVNEIPAGRGKSWKFGCRTKLTSGPNACPRYLYGFYVEPFLLGQSVVEKSHSRLCRTKPFGIMPVTRHFGVNVFYAEQLVL